MSRQPKSKPNQPPNSTRTAGGKVDATAEATKPDMSWRPLEGVTSGAKKEPETDRWSTRSRARVREAAKVSASAGLVQYALEELRIDIDEGAIRSSDKQTALRGLAKLAMDIEDRHSASRPVAINFGLQIDELAAKRIEEATGVDLHKTDAIAVH